MKKYGVRNSVILQQAPTGSTSLMAGVSSGIEPVYEFEFIRRDRLGEHTLRHPLYETWFEEYKKEHGKEPAIDCLTRDHAQCTLHKGLIEAANERAKKLLAEKWDAPALKRAR